MKLWAALCAVAVTGSVLLVALAPRAHPARQWKVSSDREQSQLKAREISAALGVDTAGWSAAVTAGTGGHAGYFAQLHPASPEARRFSPVFPKVALQGPGAAGRILVSLSAAGDTNLWEWKKYPKSAALAAEAAQPLAQNALDKMLGAEASKFHLLPDIAQNSDGRLFAFESAGPLVERFEATVDGSRLVKAELTAHYGPEIGDGMSARKKYVNWLTAAVVIALYIVGTMLAGSVYVFWAMRRAVRHRFVLLFSAAASILWGGVYWLNWLSQDGRFDAMSGTGSVGENFFGGFMGLCGLFLLLFIWMGASDALGPHNKLLTLRSLFSTDIFNRDAGASLLAGLLCGPLLAALPLAVSSLHLGASQQTGDYQGSVLFAIRPAMQALDAMVNPALIGLFGFGVGFLSRYVRKPRLATALLAVAGTLLLATLSHPSETAPATFLLSGALLFAAYYQLLLRVDLLAVLAAGWCAQVLWEVAALAVQPAASFHVSAWGAGACLAAFAGFAAIVVWRGSQLAIEDGAAPAIVTSQRDALMKEFSIAHRVQQQMLPQHPPEIAGCTLAASCQPALEVGGDLFDFLQLPDGRWSIGVGDVSGKGVPAALYMTLTKGLLAATTQDSSDLVEIIGNVNGHLHAATERKTFVTMALGAYDPETRAFDHVRAGHNPIVWRQPSVGGTSLLNAPGLGLGIVSDRLFRRSVKPERVQLSSGDALVFYSDGVTEAMNEAHELYGEDRLMRAVEDADGLDAGRVREKILESVRAFLDGVTAQDDMTIVVLRVN